MNKLAFDFTTAPAPQAGVAIPDMCVIGIMIRGFQCTQDWLAANPEAILAITPEVLAENIRGEESISDLKPEFAAAIRAQREELFDARGLEVGYDGVLTEAIDSMLADPRIGMDLRQSRGFMMRMSIVAAARRYDLPILSSNGFYPRLAQHVEIPKGVYDIYRQRWIVRSSEHV